MSTKKLLKRSLIVSSFVAASAVGLLTDANASTLEIGDEFGGSTTFLAGLNKGTGNTASTIEMGDRVSFFFCDAQTPPPGTDVGSDPPDQVLECGNIQDNDAPPSPVSYADFSFSPSLGSNNGGFEPLQGETGSIRSFTIPLVTDPDVGVDNWIVASVGDFEYEWDITFPINIDFDAEDGEDFVEVSIEGDVTKIDTVNGTSQTEHFTASFSVEDLFTPENDFLDFFENDGDVPPEFVTKSSTASINGQVVSKVPEPSSLFGLAALGSLALVKKLKKINK